MTTPTLTPAPDFSSDRAQDVRRLLLIPLCALIAILPLVRNGCSCGHDFDFHLLNWMEAAKQFSHGNFQLHWAFTPAFNAGEPRFVFYPPISWVLGAALGLLLTHLPGLSESTAWSAAPIAFTWIALTTSGLTLYRLARLFVASNAALLAAIVYLVNPYMLFTAYERTAYAELLAAAWIPLLFQAILSDRVTSPRIAIPVALLWLTNAPAAVMGCYTLALLTLARVVAKARGEESRLAPNYQSALVVALKAIFGTTLGLALAAFYIIPAAYERRYVQITMATITGMRIDQNFLFEHTGVSPDELLHDQVLHTASIIAVIMLIVTLIALAATLHRNRSRGLSNSLVTTLLLLAAGIAFLLTPISLPIWNHVPQSLFLQFSWRLLAILAAILAMAAALVFNRFAMKSAPVAFAGVAMAIVLSHPAYHVLKQPCDPEDTAPARLALFHSPVGTGPTDEYTPETADNDSLVPNNPPDWLASSAEGKPSTGALPGPTPMHFSITAPQAEYLVLNLRNYPAWKISCTSQDSVVTPDVQHLSRLDGLIALPIPAGTSTIDIHYANSLDQTIGDATSAVGLAFLLFMGLRRLPHSPR